MLRISRKTTALAVSSVLVVGALAGPSMASAKKIKFTVKVDNITTGTKLSGKVTGGTFGKGTQKGTALPPKISATWKLKGGTITWKSPDGHIDGPNILGTCKMTGTGKYKKLKAKCKVVGVLATNKFVFTGSGTI
jgi:hypothetical protein